MLSVAHSLSQSVTVPPPSVTEKNSEEQDSKFKNIH